MTVPRSERTNASLSDIRKGSQINAEAISYDTRTEGPETLESALTGALSARNRIALVSVDLDTGESRTIFVM